MTSHQTSRRGVRFHVAEVMGLVLLIALVLRWPPLLFPGIPIALYLCLKTFRVTLGGWAWAVITTVALLAYPLTGGPILKANIWLAENGYLPRGRVPTWSLYRPLFRLAYGTPFEGVLNKYTELWLGRFGWNPLGH
jgi:hypothetical protein